MNETTVCNKCGSTFSTEETYKVTEAYTTPQGKQKMKYLRVCGNCRDTYFPDMKDKVLIRGHPSQVREVP
ncbi:MAG: hypothetical protein P1Q69_07360 [Candidatus Thorarchaeota archaeon]|nr:hypothetical protein [Candidatus Thorarchaeota archaeon]